MKLTPEQKQAITTLKNVKKQLLTVNDALNNEINALEKCTYGGTERQHLRVIRDTNIRTIQVIQELELKELLE